MFEIGWTEMLVIAVVMIVVVGPKDLPKMLRTFGKMTAKMRGMAGDFQKQFNEALKEAELDDVKKSVDSLRGLNPASEIRKQLNPFEKAAADVRSGLDNAMKPKPAATEAKPAEPLKTGATGMPVEGPEKMPEEPPLFPAMSDPAAEAAPVAPAPAAPAAQPAQPAKADVKPAIPAAADAVKPVAEKAAPKPAKAAKATPAAKAAPAQAAKSAPAPSAPTTNSKAKAQSAGAKPPSVPAKAQAEKPRPATAKKKPAGSAA